MPEFYVTFGPGQIAGSPVPTVSADGWLTVVAPDELYARRIVAGVFLGRWSMIYTSPLDRSTYPLGEIARITVCLEPPSMPAAVAAFKDAWHLKALELRDTIPADGEKTMAGLTAAAPFLQGLAA